MPEPPDKLVSYWGLPSDDLLSALESSPAGLTSAEAARRLKQFGPNALDVHRHVGWFWLLFHQFTNPLVLILLFAVAVSLFVREWTDAAVILTIVVGSALISFAQEYAAS